MTYKLYNKKYFLKDLQQNTLLLHIKGILSTLFFLDYVIIEYRGKA